MAETTIYKFDDISIIVDTKSDKLHSYIEEFTFIKTTDNIFNKKISFSFIEDGSFVENCFKVPDDAAVEIDVPFEMDEGIRFRGFTRGNTEIWYIYDGYGSVYINLGKKEIAANWHNEEDAIDIIGFILLFIHPLNKVLGEFGYIRLHAACIKVNKKNIIITGISGRGKSTATFALLNSGYNVLSDEMPLIKKIDGGFNAYTLLNIIKLRQHALDTFFMGFERVFFRSGEDCFIKLSDLNMETLFCLQGIHQIFILEQTGKEETVIKPARPMEVIPELFPFTINVILEKQVENVFQTVVDLIDSVNCYKIFFGTNMEEFSRQIEKVE